MGHADQFLPGHNEASKNMVTTLSQLKDVSVKQSSSKFGQFGL